jgi:phage tail sheath protein FI
MPVAPTYPGVYIEEVPSGVRTIAGVSTARTAFVGRARMGPVETPTIIFSFAEYERIFGGLWALSSMSFAVQQYFQNGGGEAVIVRVFAGVAADTVTFAVTVPPAAPPTTITLAASSPGAWASGLKLTVDHLTRDPAKLVNITVKRNADDLETLRNVAVADLRATLAQRSAFLVFPGTTAAPTNLTDGTYNTATNGGDGGDVTNVHILGSQGTRTGIFALEKTDIFNILCLPPPNSGDITAVYTDAAKYCSDRRAMLLINPHGAANVAGATAEVADARTKAGSFVRNAAYFFPSILALNRLSGMVEPFAPSGAVAGIFARTDAQRGVWKAPAGVEAAVNGALGLDAVLTDGDNGLLNQIAVNCLRIFPIYGTVVWGARTLDGSDQQGSEWKYIPIRRLALYIEESLFRGLKWVVFEPNDEPLWAQIRLNVGAFMNNLFRQGAFQGSAPKDAYFVLCDKTTNPQNDIDRGIVNVVVGFAPLKPAEFVIIKIQQIAGQIQT